MRHLNKTGGSLNDSLREKRMGLSRFELESLAPKADRTKATTEVTQGILKQYMDICSLEGICKEWLYTIDRLHPEIR